MTLVRRSSRCTQSCPFPCSNDFWNGVVPSRETIIKAESAKLFLEAHFENLISESQARRDRYESVMKTAEEIGLEPEEKETIKNRIAQEETKFCRITRTKIKPSRFERIQLIGRGGFGEVWLVHDKLSCELCALKVLRKADIIRSEQILNVRTERDILSFSHNPWVVSLKCSFQDNEKLYLVLEYIPGGDLMNALIKQSVFTEPTAKFFAGEILLAAHSVHEISFIHRDIKPDNVLISESGHIKLTDFGLSKNYAKNDAALERINEEITDIIFGQSEGIKPRHVRGNEIATCDYTAPEVLRGECPTTKSDLWSIGVIIYEMLYGFAPFSGKSIQETALRVIHWKHSLRFPNTPQVSSVAKDLLIHILCDHNQRYDYEQIIHHPFFNGFDFTNYKANIPPLVPVLRSPTDTSHFDIFEQEECPLGYDLPYSNLANFAFLGFTFKKRPHQTILAQEIFSPQ